MAWSRTSRHARGYGTRWDRQRRIALDRDMHLCQPCLKAGRTTPGAEVDHITPKAKGGTDDFTNLQAICKSCHDEKTAQENGRQVRRQVGLDGWPA